MNLVKTYDYDLFQEPLTKSFHSANSVLLVNLLENPDAEQIYFRVPYQTCGNHLVSAVEHQDRRSR